jgi:hypothetical protein
MPTGPEHVRSSRAVAKLGLRPLSASRTVEVLDPLHPEVWARPVQQPTVIYVQVPGSVLEPEASQPSKRIPWALIAVALAILVFSCFAAWHTSLGPQLDPARPHQVDLVGPSR